MCIYNNVYVYVQLYVCTYVDSHKRSGLQSAFTLVTFAWPHSSEDDSRKNSSLKSVFTVP